MDMVPPESRQTQFLSASGSGKLSLIKPTYVWEERGRSNWQPERLGLCSSLTKVAIQRHHRRQGPTLLLCVVCVLRLFI